jgi:hypothetical protein
MEWRPVSHREPFRLTKDAALHRIAAGALREFAEPAAAVRSADQRLM